MSGLDDVIPIGVGIRISDAVQDMWMGRRICDVYGFGEDGWTDSMILDYLVAVTEFHDKFVESQSPWNLPDYWHDLRLPDGIRTISGLHDFSKIRDFVAKCYDKYTDKSMSEILCKLHLLPYEWQDSVCANKGRERMPQIDLGHVRIMEDYFTAVEPPYPMGDLMTQTKLSRRTLETFRKQFTRRRLLIHGDAALVRNRASDRLRQLVASGAHTNNDCLRIVHEETGIQFSKSYVSKLRCRPQPRKKKKP